MNQHLVSWPEVKSRAISLRSDWAQLKGRWGQFLGGRVQGPGPWPGRPGGCPTGCRCVGLRACGRWNLLGQSEAWLHLPLAAASGPVLNMSVTCRRELTMQRRHGRERALSELELGERSDPPATYKPFPSSGAQTLIVKQKDRQWHEKCDYVSWLTGPRNRTTSSFL